MREREKAGRSTTCARTGHMPLLRPCAALDRPPRFLPSTIPASTPAEPILWPNQESNQVEDSKATRVHFLHASHM